jgi:hypothetical protein
MAFGLGGSCQWFMAVVYGSGLWQCRIVLVQGSDSPRMGGRWASYEPQSV